MMSMYDWMTDRIAKASNAFEKLGVPDPHEVSAFNKRNPVATHQSVRDAEFMDPSDPFIGARVYSYLTNGVCTYGVYSCQRRPETKTLISGGKEVTYTVMVPSNMTRL
jgi:hypothetical protein